MKTHFITLNQDYIEKYNLDPNYIGKSIVLYDNQVPHLNKHMNEFSSYQSYQNAKDNLLSILESPDFISNDNKNNSLLFVKTMTDNVLVAVRISNNKELKVRTMYPINNNKKIK